MIKTEGEGYRMKTGELLTILSKNGIKKIRSGKKHDLYYSPITGITFPVPRHKAEIAAGTLKSILTDAGLK